MTTSRLRCRSREHERCRHAKDKLKENIARPIGAKCAVERRGDQRDGWKLGFIKVVIEAPPPARVFPMQIYSPASLWNGADRKPSREITATHTKMLTAMRWLVKLIDRISDIMNRDNPR